MLERSSIDEGLSDRRLERVDIVQRNAPQSRFGRCQAPGLVRNPAHREPHRAEAPTIGRDRGRRGHQGELVGFAITDL